MPKRSRAINAARDNLIAAMSELGITQTQLARELNVGASAVHNYLEPWRTLTPDTLQKVVNALNAIGARNGRAIGWTPEDLVADKSRQDERIRNSESIPVKLFTDPPRFRETIPPPVDIVSLPSYYGGSGATAVNTFIMIAFDNSLADYGVRKGFELICRTDLAPRAQDLVVGWVADAPTLGVLTRRGGMVRVVIGDMDDEQIVIVHEYDELYPVVAWVSIGRTSDDY